MIGGWYGGWTVGWVDGIMGRSYWWVDGEVGG